MGAAGKKLAPDAVESKLNVQNGGVTIPVICLESAPKAGPAYLSSFFEIGSVPTMLELTYRTDDPKREQYRSIVKDVIAGITLGDAAHK